MIEQITHIKLKNNHLLTTENIAEVKLMSGETRSIRLLIDCLEMGEKYYYYNQKNQVVYIEVVHLLYKDPYIQSSNAGVNGDQLLELPRF